MPTVRVPTVRVLVNPMIGFGDGCSAASTHWLLLL